MVKRDWRPWKEVLGEMIPTALFLAVGNWALKGVPLWQALLGGCGFALFWGAIRGWKEFKRLRRAEQRRQAAASGTQWFPLASPQPYPDPEALPLPFVIARRAGWLAYLLAPLITWIVLLFGVYFWFWQYVWPHYGSLIHTLSLSLVLPVAVEGVIFLGGRDWIEVDDQGLTIRTLFRSQSILWHEARLFVVDAALKADNKANRYELSSTTSIMRWTIAQKPSHMNKLSCSFEEYTWQMKALHAVIAARTGLPLYDLRDGVTTNAPQAVPYPLPPPPVPQP